MGLRNDLSAQQDRPKIMYTSICDSRILYDRMIQWRGVYIDNNLSKVIDHNISKWCV